MIYGSETQNSSLSKAGQKRSESSGKTHTSNGLVARIGSNKSSGTKHSNTEVVSNSELKKTISDPIKGSLEGLDNSSSGHILMSGDGYDNPNFQKARYKDKTIKKYKQESLNYSNSEQPKMIKNNAIMNNYTNRYNSDNIANRMREYIGMNDYLGKNG